MWRPQASPIVILQQPDGVADRLLLGLVLAVLPLIISALEHYNEGLKPLKDFIRYKQVIRELVVDLGTQRALFRNTLEKLLSGSVASDVTLALLLEHPGGERWQDGELALDLKRRLQGSFTVYMESVRDMDNLTEVLKDKMGLDAGGKACSHGSPLRNLSLTCFFPSLDGSMPAAIRRRGRSL